ncbi:TonB-dependent receptor plug domain-containing protein [Aggregatibacter actinomycetemcomitans]|uniref:TonB-dependent receptor plug domain-containing protein n=1 Tax=Aggregatibacter actinomycetemcomitans TaxID=714 RepID=UPI0027E3AD03|nr:TonB-dependent receptor plug domain-containing protein [Aggregatibacter actinomycetemcomitans]
MTGLGKVVKTTETINREQVLNIRDLTRYDPGISVVEQGRGASSGYSIRGMDRNRISLSVDGSTSKSVLCGSRSTGGRQRLFRYRCN